MNNIVTALIVVIISILTAILILLALMSSINNKYLYILDAECYRLDNNEKLDFTIDSNYETLVSNKYYITDKKGFSRVFIKDEYRCKIKVSDYE